MPPAGLQRLEWGQGGMTEGRKGHLGIAAASWAEK